MWGGLEAAAVGTDLRAHCGPPGGGPSGPSQSCDIRDAAAPRADRSGWGDGRGGRTAGSALDVRQLLGHPARADAEDVHAAHVPPVVRPLVPVERPADDGAVTRRERLLDLEAGARRGREEPAPELACGLRPLVA